jgi:hypothetical protein
MSAVRRFLGDHSLSLVMLGFFLVIHAGESVAAHHTFNADQRDHHEPVVSYPEYVTSGDFGETVFENWESEFLAVGALVVLSVYLRQQGSPESKPVAAPHDTTG